MLYEIDLQLQKKMTSEVRNSVIRLISFLAGDAPTSSVQKEANRLVERYQKYYDQRLLNALDQRLLDALDRLGE